MIDKRKKIAADGFNNNKYQRLFITNYFFVDFYL